MEFVFTIQNIRFSVEQCVQLFLYSTKWMSTVKQFKRPVQVLLHKTDSKVGVHTEIRFSEPLKCFTTLRNGGVYNLKHTHTHWEGDYWKSYVLTLCVSSQNYPGMQIDTPGLKPTWNYS